MSAENETSNQAVPHGGEAGEQKADDASGSELTVSAAGGGKDEPEEKRLRIVVQVEVRAQIDEVAAATKLPTALSKISVVSEQQLLGGIRIIGGGD